MKNSVLRTMTEVAIFAALGIVTKMDLSKLSTYLFMGLIGIIICGIINIFIGSSTVDFVLSIIGIILFVGYTAYDVKVIMNTEKFEEFISQYPIFEYRLLDTKDIGVEERVRTICRQECERYDSTWACPPAVGTLQECEKKIKSYPQAIFFSSVAEVSDIMNMEELLSTRRAHEDLTTEVGKYLNREGYETYILSTESCDICEKCAYKEGKPCRFPDRMHPCLESHGVVVNEIVERESMEYNLGGNTILWFSMVLFR